MTTAVPTVVSGSFLTLHYRLTGPDGADVVNTFHDKPATLTIGSGELSPAPKPVLMGLQEGTRTVMELPAGEAFGPHNPEMVQKVAMTLMRELGDPDETWRVGDVVRFPPRQQEFVRRCGARAGWQRLDPVRLQSPAGGPAGDV